MKKGIWKRILCVATATVVCLTSIPGTVFADETGCKEAKDGKHVPNEDKKELVKMATCTEDGEWLIYCLYCNTQYTTEVIPATGHEWGDKKQIREAGCVTTGEVQYTCQNCNEVKTETIPAKGHTIVTDKGVTPTCTQTGLTEGKHCSVCKKVITRQQEIPAKGHKIVTDPAVEATCTQSGLTEGTHCSDCNEVIQKQETIAALGHEYLSGAIYDKKTAQVVDICKRCAKQTKRLANLVSLIGDEQNTKFEDMDGKEISSIPDNLKIFSGESEDGKRNLLYVNEKDEKQLREFSMLSEHKELNNLTLQFGKDENAGTIQMDAADGINQLGIRMKPYENGEVLIYVSEDIVNASIKNIKKNGNSIICETDNGSKLAISSDHMNYKVGKTDVPKKKDDSVLNQLVAKRVEGSEDTVEFSLQQVEEEQKDSKTEDTAKTEDKSASEEPMEPIRIIFETKEMAKDEEEDEKKSQDDSTQIKMIEEDEPTQKIEKIKDEEPSIIIIRFVDPPVEEKKEEKEEEKQEEVKTVNFEFETLHTSCTISGYKYCSFKEVNDNYIYPFDYLFISS